MAGAATADSPGSRSGDPNVALFLTWLVPGAGHLYLGRTGFALLAFALVEGLYWLGVQLSDGLFLNYLPPEMQGRFAAALTPEVGNLGALIWHVRSFGYLPPNAPVPWPATMDLGTTLTAASGVLNLFLMARAHLDARLAPAARRPRLGPAYHAFLCWVLPGLGHVAQGRRRRGAIVFFLLVGLFLLGTLLADGANLDRERHFYYWAGQFFLGPFAIAAEFFHGHPRITGDLLYADAGIVLACIAGMLNVLCMLDTYSWEEDRLLGRTSAPREPAEAPA